MSHTIGTLVRNALKGKKKTLVGVYNAVAHAKHLKDHTKLSAAVKGEIDSFLSSGNLPRNGLGSRIEGGQTVYFIQQPIVGRSKPAKWPTAVRAV